MDALPVFEYFHTGGFPPVGREHELRVLASLFHSVRGGRGRLVLVSGEAGIGKTTLVEQFVADALGARIIAGACYDFESPSPYAPWNDALSELTAPAASADSRAARWLDNLERGGFADQNALFSEVRRRLASAAADTPIALVLEDIHWADTESLSLLRYMARAVRTMPVLIVATYRDDEISSGHPLYDILLPLVRESGAERIALRRFTASDIATMIAAKYRLDFASAGTLVDELAHRTDGNPFFIVELLRSMEQTGVLSVEDGCWRFEPSPEMEIPLLVRQLIERRLHQLDPRIQPMLQTAAILGFEIRPDLLASLIEEDAAELSALVREAVEARLLEQPPYGDRLRFRHALVQEALYASATIPWRQSQHRRIAEMLSSRPDAEPAVIADHFHRAGDARARTWMIQAARRARQLYAPNSIIQHLRYVLDDPHALSVDERMEALRLRGWAHMITGDFQSANRDYLAESQAARDSGNRRAEWDALIRLAELWTGRDYQRVGEYVEQTLQVTREMNDHALMAHSHNRFGTWCMSQDEPDRARAHHEAALKNWSSIGDQTGIAESHDLLGLTLALSGNLEDAAHHFRRAVSLYQTSNDRQGLSTSRANRAHLGPNYLTDMVVAASALDDCIHEGRQALEIAGEIGYRAGEVYAEIRLGYCFGASGAYQQALESANRSIASSEEIGNRQLLSAAYALAGQLRLDLFDPANARRSAELSREIAERIDSTFRIRMAAAILAMVHIAEGNVEAAESELRAVWPDESAPRTLAQHLLWRASIELELSRDDPESALRRIDSLPGSTPQTSRQRPALRLSLLRGRALNGMERHDEAASWLEPARAAALHLGASALLWRIHQELGLAHWARGDRQNASRAFTEARRVVREIGETLIDSDAKARFFDAAWSTIPQTTDLTPLQAAKQSFGGLTRRQRQVAGLIAEGSSNRVIADTLSISERTVESHITAILTKLELSSRAQVVAWCIEHELTGGDPG